MTRYRIINSFIIFHHIYNLSSLGYRDRELERVRKLAEQYEKIGREIVEEIELLRRF